MEVGAAVRVISCARGFVRSAPSLVGAARRENRRPKHSDSGSNGVGLHLSTQSCLEDIRLQGSTPGSLGPDYLQIAQHRSKVAISDINGDYLYEDVYMRSWDLAKGIAGLLGENSRGQRICFLCPHGLTHVITTWACWMSGHVAVPLCPSSSHSRLEHVIQDSGCAVVVATKDQVERVRAVTRQHGQKLVMLDETWWEGPKELGETLALPPPMVEVNEDQTSNALILYTAGFTTGRPKGVVLTHDILRSQIDRVVEAWDWGPTDNVLHCLNLGSVYGLINSLQAPLSTGARITLMPQFDPLKVWSHLLGVGGTSSKAAHKINTFPGVPSMYLKLLSTAEEIFKGKKTHDYVKATCSKRIRLMMSSTATLPQSVTQQWRNVTGHQVLENYISTEAGTALSNSFNRVAGSSKVSGPGCQDCGAPTTNTQTQIIRFRDHTKTKYDVLATGGVEGINVTDNKEDSIIGELLLKGDHIAQHYWMDGTQVPIDHRDGWLVTGDIVQVHHSCYRLRGRLGISTINCKGRQVSAAAVEKKLLSCRDIDDCYVVGLGDVQSEQKIAAVVVLNSNRKVNMEIILKWCEENMEEAEVPTVFKMVTEIVRDSTGHVDKLKLGEMFADMPVICYHDSKM